MNTESLRGRNSNAYNARRVGRPAGWPNATILNLERELGTRVRPARMFRIQCLLQSTPEERIDARELSRGLGTEVDVHGP